MRRVKTSIQSKNKLTRRRRILREKPLYDEVVEKQNNFHCLTGLKPWEKEYLRLLQWSYVHRGHPPRVKGCLNLFDPLRCEETLVRIDQNDVKAVLKIMGHNWLADQKKKNRKKRNERKKRSTKNLDELVQSISIEEDELVGWWKRPYCIENVLKSIKVPKDSAMKPLYFNSFDVEEKLWGFVERMKSAANRPAHIMTEKSSAGSKSAHKLERKSRI